jgi:hypothetical protein
MEKKYYFRGLGLGIIVTAVIMGIALSGGGKKEKMTDDEIIARAKQLGMIEDSTLLEASGEENTEDGQAGNEAPVQKENAVKKDDPVKKDVAVAAQKEEEKKPVPVPDAETPVAGTPESLQEKEDRATAAESGEPDAAENAGRKPTEKKPSADTNEMTKQDEDVPGTSTKSAGGTKTVTIASGDGSYTVARKLAEAGVVDSADAYDSFLCANGYDKKLRPGIFTIPSDAGDEQIARIVTGQQ